jgi:hypothetical protein
MLRATAKPDKIAFLEHRAVILDELALENEELFMAIVAVRPGRHAGGHAIDVEADPQRLIVIELQHLVAKLNAVLEHEGFVGGFKNVGNASVFSLDWAHGSLLTLKRRRHMPQIVRIFQ